MKEKDVSKTRRNLLKGIAGAKILPFMSALTALQSIQACGSGGVSPRPDSPYGRIAPTNDLVTGLPLLQLPAGFTYSSFGWQGDLMTNGRASPGGHDGMGVIASRSTNVGSEIVLVRNHEIGYTVPDSFLEAPAIYDRGTNDPSTGNTLGGGTTNLVFRNGQWLSMTPSLGGTQNNCAGGVTPWGTWLTCEEVGVDSIGTAGKKHGYVFEVHEDPEKTIGQPIVGMGRFAHEAAAVDPKSGIVYMTEDSPGKSGFYRYVPSEKNGTYGSLAKGGTLQMAKVKGINNASFTEGSVGTTYALEWAPIANPDQDRGDTTGPSGFTITNASGPFAQGWTLGAARMDRGEGIWHFKGKIYVMETSGGSASRGSVWELDLDQQTLKNIYSSPNAQELNMGDNLTVSPGGGLLLCEDGGVETADAFGIGERLIGLTVSGEPYIFAKNNVNLTASEVATAGKVPSAAGDHRLREFCGACFDPTGQFLFVNIQTPGITFAITGPWEKGPLK